MIYYLVADHHEPSWGSGMLYEHVGLLRELGYPATVLHHSYPHRPSWRDLEVPVSYLDGGLDVAPTDVVVVPEVLASSPVVATYPWRRVVFVQGAFLILGGLGANPSYPALGFEAAMAVLPSVAHVVERHFGIPALVVPPYVAPYFFGTESEPRQSRVLLATKEGYRLAGVPDGAIAERLLAAEVGRRAGWSLVKLEGFPHVGVAALMKTSQFLINVHSHESFNATVPEAMAAGCVALCYEACGGRDFLRDGENAIVFQNQQVFALVERLCELMDGFDASGELLERLRAGGRATAASYNPAATARRLGLFYSDVLRLSPS